MDDKSMADLIDSWRATADIWEEAMDEDVKRRHVCVPGAKQPPSKRNADIRNWINWLRGIANDVESAVAARGSARGPTPGERER